MLWILLHIFLHKITFMLLLINNKLGGNNMDVMIGIIFVTLMIVLIIILFKHAQKNELEQRIKE